ncbi:MAG: hypothetical protein KDB80_14590 [Planctomycetes bacterium]|nr:hypothetical protein [Planctomycetota bacterium]
MRISLARILSAVCLTVSLPAQAPQRALVEKLCEAYAARGFEIDPAKLSIETADDERMTADLDAQQDFFFAPHHFEVTGLMYEAIGAVSDADAMREIAIDGSKATLHAYFHYPRNALVFLDNELSDFVGIEPIVAHELGHAWRHVARDMSKLAAKSDRTSDDAKTLQCLLEGEAELISMDLLFSRQGRALAEIQPYELDNALTGVAHPAVTLPYEVGRKFMHARFVDKGWDAVHRALEQRPTSSEQVLHPTKLGRDQPTALDLPAWTPLDAPLEPIATDVIGECAILTMLLVKKCRVLDAKLAASGWDGDRLVLYRWGDDEWLIGWRTLWDREADAAQFAAALHGIRGEVRTEGRTVDWAWASRDDFEEEFLQLLAGRATPAADEADAASTTAVEAAIERSARPATLEDGIFVHTGHGVRFSVPAGWTLQEVNGEQSVMAPPADGFRDNINTRRLPRRGLDIDGVLAENRTFFESSDRFELHSIEKVHRGEADAVHVEWGGKLNGRDLRFFVLILLTDDSQVIVTATTLEKHVEARREATEATLASARLIE